MELFIDGEISLPTEDENCITVWAEWFKAFYQPITFITGNKVNIFRNERLNKFNSHFLIPLMDVEVTKKFNYGRGATKDRLTELQIKIPVTLDNEPDWQFMEDYIKTLPYSSNL